MSYKTTKDLLDRFIVVTRLRADGRGSVIYGFIDGMPYCHQFGIGSEAEMKLLDLSPSDFPVSVKIVKKGRCLDLEFREEVKHA